MTRRLFFAFFAVVLFFPNIALSVPAPAPVYIVSNAPQADAVSTYVSNISLGDIWVLQLVLGLVQCVLLGAIHGHQR